jgi:DNA-binding response OmpR family regulator
MEITDKPHIMILDDSEFMRQFLGRFLGEKFSMTLVADGVEALEKLQTGYRPEVILADINMPRLDGFGFLEHVKASPLLASIPIIMCSAKDDSNDRIKSLRLGAVDYVVKPFNPIELELRIESHRHRTSV